MGNAHSLNACTVSGQEKGRNFNATYNSATTTAVLSCEGSKTSYSRVDCQNKECKTSATHPDWTPKVEAETRNAVALGEVPGEGFWASLAKEVFEEDRRQSRMHGPDGDPSRHYCTHAACCHGLM
jgi:hypothetical protein